MSTAKKAWWPAGGAALGAWALCLAAGWLGERWAPGLPHLDHGWWLGAAAAVAVAVGFAGRRRLAAALLWVLAGVMLTLAGPWTPVAAPLAAGAVVVYSGARGAGKLRRLVAFSLALLALWGAIEVGLDVRDPAGVAVEDNLSEKLRTWNLYGHTNLLGNHDRAATARLRDQAWPLAKSPTEKRVICLGSSSTFGAGLDAGDAYPAALQRALGEPWRVGNAGWGGYNSFQLGIYLRQVLLRLSPDLVIFYYGGNERYGADTVGYWRHATALLHGYDAPTPDHAEKALRYGTTHPLAMTVVDTLQGLRLYRRLRGLVASGRRQTRFASQPSDRLDSATVLDEMLDAATRAGARVLLVPEVSVELGVVNADYAALMARAASERDGVTYLNVADKLLDPVNFIDTTHLNAGGAARLGALLAPVVRRLCDDVALD